PGPRRARAPARDAHPAAQSRDPTRRRALGTGRRPEVLREPRRSAPAARRRTTGGGREAPARRARVGAGADGYVSSRPSPRPGGEPPGNACDDTGKRNEWGSPAKRNLLGPPHSPAEAWQGGRRRGTSAACVRLLGTPGALAVLET